MITISQPFFPSCPRIELTFLVLALALAVFHTVREAWVKVLTTNPNINKTPFFTLL